MKHPQKDENAALASAKGSAPLQGAALTWIDAQNSLAAKLGVSLLLVEGNQPPELAIANNNSICREIQNSQRHAHLCAPYCGEAFNRAMKAGGAASYRCHAGLHCITMPVTLDKTKNLAIIGGRAFLTTEDYRNLAERIRVGDLNDMVDDDLFENVIFAVNEDLNDLAIRVSALASEYETQPTETSSTPLKSTVTSPPSARGRVRVNTSPQAGKVLVGAIDEACQAAMRDLADKYSLASLALFVCTDGEFEATIVTGKFTGHSTLLRVDTNDRRLFEAVRNGESVLMVETRDGIEMASEANTNRRHRAKKTLELFPLIIENDVKGALLVADSSLDADARLGLSDFCRDLAMPLEVLRLRAELEKRARFADSLKSFTRGISAGDPTESFSSILSHSSELLRSRRSSLLLYDEISNELTVKAAFGPRAKFASAERVRLGDGVSGAVLQNGRPLVVRDLDATDCEPAPADRLYQTRSFISFPITIRGRKLGVLNITDKEDGSPYDEADLGLLETLAPQMALALDRADWQEKAAQFQLISITDPLTGLLNRRYLEERLAEELRRSERQNYAMSFLMIDIDDFKYYNDHNGHQAGDLALETVAQCLKSVLRAADVASRYGGEEFCILLPQTKLDEAIAIAQRIRQRVEDAHFPNGNAQPLGVVTVSIGVSAFDERHQTPAAIIGAADRALYTAKGLGKNRVQVLDENSTAVTTRNANERPQQD